MSFKSATEMGKEIGISYQKVNKILAENNLYDKASNRPTSYALKNKLAEMRTTTSRFTKKAVEFIAWDFGKLDLAFPKPLKHEVAIQCHSPMDALDKICGAFSDYGSMLNIELSTPQNDISKEAQYAVVQAYYGDPGYLRGTLLFHRFFNPYEAEIAKKCTLTFANELFNAAVKIDAVRAKSNLQIIETVMSWLCEKAR
jgi:hypothetical protein